MTFEEWVKRYEKSDDSRFVLARGEQIVFDPEHGFFTYVLNAGDGSLIIPKMCGTLKHWRKLIEKMYYASIPLGVRRVFFCTKRNPFAFIRILGGRLAAMERFCDFERGKDRTVWYIAITTKNYKKDRRGDHGEQTQEQRTTV